MIAEEAVPGLFREFQGVGSEEGNDMLQETEKYLKNIYSQFGEDGLIEEIFRRIGTTNKWCFEVGAADGKWMSNSRKLIDDGWSAVLIERDDARYAKLLESFGTNPSVRLCKQEVGDKGLASLDSILQGRDFPEQADLGIIDIDGQDYYVWLAMMKYKPRVMVVEYDPRVAVDFIPERNGAGQAGRDAIISVGSAKGYDPVCLTPVNVIFVDRRWSKTIESSPEPTTLKSSLKLNIGGGTTQIPGFENVDRKQGKEAFPLGYQDNSVAEVRASHVLEHFGVYEIDAVLADWIRVLEPGGTIKIAVPDFDKAIALRLSDPKWHLYIMGGQTDANDFHKTIFSEKSLRTYMERAGLIDIKPWETDGLDTSCHPVSLNLMGTKASATPKQGQMQDIKIKAIVSVPRIGWNSFWHCAGQALSPFGIQLQQFTGVFWGQCMQRAFEEAVEQGVDWVMTLDYDSMFTKDHVSRMLHHLGTRPEIDAIAALQCRRGSLFPLMTSGNEKEREIDGGPIKVTTAHFGLTLLRVDALKNIPKPWFKSEPDKNGGWGDDRLDDDIWFWHQWRLAGKTIYVAPDVRIGHIEEMVSTYDERMQPSHMYVKDWRKMVGLEKKTAA